MSWRLNIAPAMPNPEIADWTIPPDATPEQVDEVADSCTLVPLRIFSPSQDDWRLKRLVERLAEHGFGPEYYTIFVRESDRFVPL